MIFHWKQSPDVGVSALRFSIKIYRAAGKESLQSTLRWKFNPPAALQLVRTRYLHIALYFPAYRTRPYRAQRLNVECFIWFTFPSTARRLPWTLNWIRVNLPADCTGRSRRSTHFTVARRFGARWLLNLYEIWRWVEIPAFPVNSARWNCYAQRSTLISLDLPGHDNLDLQRGLVVREKVRVRYSPNVPRGVRQCATRVVLRSNDRQLAGGEGNFGEARLRGLRGSKVQGTWTNSTRLTGASWTVNRREARKTAVIVLGFVWLAGISGMSGKIIGRDALSDLHGSQLGHRPVSLWTRGGLFGLRQALRALSTLSGGHWPLSNDLSSDRADAPRQAPFEIDLGNYRAGVRRPEVHGGDSEESFRHRDHGEW